MRGGMVIAALSISLMIRLNKTESAVFLYCRFPLFLKDPYSQIIIVILFLRRYASVFVFSQRGSGGIPMGN